MNLMELIAFQLIAFSNTTVIIPIQSVNYCNDSFIIAKIFTVFLIVKFYY